VLLLPCVVSGYLLAEWWSGGRDTTRLAKICGRVDYMSGLQQEFGGDAAEEMREQLTALVEECRTALRNRLGDRLDPWPPAGARHFRP